MFVYFNEIFSFPDAVTLKKIYSKENVQHFEKLDDNFFKKLMIYLKLKK